MKFLRDEFFWQLLLYIASIAWFGGIAHTISASDESTIIKVFFYLGLGVIGLKLIHDLNERG